MPRTTDELLGLLDLETIDDNLFRGTQQASVLPRVYGGQVAAQAIVAASRTTQSQYALHSLHSYFLQPGDPSTPIIYDVEVMRDSRSFSTRRVTARQHGRPIFTLTADFHVGEAGREHQDRMPTGVPTPEESVDPRAFSNEDDSEWGSLDFRYAASSMDRLADDVEHPGRQQYWFRAAQEMPDDPIAHAAVFTYASDMMIAGAALVPHRMRLGDRRTRIASLDHAVWFHRPFRVDQWWLFDQVSPVGSEGRSLINGRVFTQDGTLVASVSQEALMRPIEPQGA